MKDKIKIEPVDHDVLVLKFNCILSQEIRDRVSKEIREEYKTGLIFVPAYMDVYVVKSKSYIAKEDAVDLYTEDKKYISLHSRED